MWSAEIRTCRGYQMNVEAIDVAGRRIRPLCFMGRLVTGDVMLAQKLALELFEADALRITIPYAPGGRTRLGEDCYTCGVWEARRVSMNPSFASYIWTYSAICMARSSVKCAPYMRLVRCRRRGRMRREPPHPPADQWGRV